MPEWPDGSDVVLNGQEDAPFDVEARMQDASANSTASTSHPDPTSQTLDDADSAGPHTTNDASPSAPLDEMGPWDHGVTDTRLDATRDGSNEPTIVMAHLPALPPADATTNGTSGLGDGTTRADNLPPSPPTPERQMPTRRLWPVVLALVVIAAAIGWGIAIAARQQDDALGDSLRRMRAAATLQVVHARQIATTAAQAAGAVVATSTAQAILLAVAHSGGTAVAVAAQRTETAQHAALVQALYTPTPTPGPQPPYLRVGLVDDLHRLSCRKPRSSLELAAFQDGVVVIHPATHLGTSEIDWRVYTVTGVEEHLYGTNTTPSVDPSWTALRVSLNDIFETLIPAPVSSANGCTACGGGGGGMPEGYVYPGPPVGTYRLKALTKSGEAIASTQITFVDSRPTPTITPTPAATDTPFPEPTATPALDYGNFNDSASVTVCTDADFDQTSSTCASTDASMSVVDAQSAHIETSGGSGFDRMITVFIARDNGDGTYTTIGNEANETQPRYSGWTLNLSDILSGPDLTAGTYRIIASISDADHYMKSDPFFLTLTGSTT